MENGQLPYDAAGQAKLAKKLLGMIRALGQTSFTTKRADKYDYIPEDEITSALRPLMVDAGIMIYPSTVSTRYHADVGLTELEIALHIVDMETGCMFTVRSCGQGNDGRDKNGVPGDRGVKKAYTAAYRYGIMKLLCISDDVDDEAAYHAKPETTPVTKTVLGSPKPETFGDVVSGGVDNVRPNGKAKSPAPVVDTTKPKAAPPEPTEQPKKRTAKPARPFTAEYIKEQYAKVQAKESPQANADIMKRVGNALWVLSPSEDEATAKEEMAMLKDFFGLKSSKDLTEATAGFILKWSGYEDKGDGSYIVNDHAEAETNFILEHIASELFD